MRIDELQVGDQLRGQDGSSLVIQSIDQRLVVNELVYNLTIENDHVYFVGNEGLLVHNESWCDLVARS